MAEDATKSGPRDAVIKKGIGVVISQGIFCILFCVSLYVCWLMYKDQSRITERAIEVITQNTAQNVRVERVLDRIERKQVEASIPLRIPYVSSRTAPTIEANNE